MKLRNIILGILALFLFSSTVFAAGRGEEGKKELVMYSPHKENLIELVVDMFEEDTGIEVNVITAGTGELIARVKTEVNNPNADVFWGGSLNTLLPEAELFEVYRSKNEVNVEDVFKNKEGVVTRFSAIPSTIVVNKKELEKALGSNVSITGYQSIIDLANRYPALRGRIANANPSKSSSSFEQLINQIWAFAYIEASEELGKDATKDDITQAHLDRAWNHVEKLISVYDKRHSAGSGAVITDVVQGETIVGLSYEMAAAQAADDSPDVEIIYPEEGSVVKADGAAIIKGAKNLENAKLFIDYLLSSKVQNSIKSVYRRAIIKDADFSGSPLAPLNQFYLIEDNEALNNKTAFLEKYAELFDK